MKRFGGLTNEGATQTIRELCTQAGLADFETAAVTNLQPQNFEEAKTLVPSIEAGLGGGTHTHTHTHTHRACDCIESPFSIKNFAATQPN